MHEDSDAAPGDETWFSGQAVPVAAVEPAGQYDLAAQEPDDEQTQGREGGEV